MLPWSPDTILIAALVVFVAIITIFVFHILLGVQRLIRLGEVRREYEREEQAYLTSLYGERWGLRTGGDGERPEQQPPEEFKEPKSQPVARPHQDQGQNLEIQRRADELEEEILRLKQDHKKLEEDLEQVREHQREVDQEKERMMEDLQSIRQPLNGRPSSKLTSVAYSKIHRLLSLPNPPGER
jgi:DNA repair exonuclease SbcCD ATPase subunit